MGIEIEGYPYQKAIPVWILKWGSPKIEMGSWTYRYQNGDNNFKTVMRMSKNPHIEMGIPKSKWGVGHTDTKMVDG